MPRVKRYVIFECDDYYPSGGWADKSADVDTLVEAVMWLVFYATHHDGASCQIVDLETGERHSIRNINIATPDDIMERLGE